MSEIKHPIGSWEIVKTSNGHGVYEKGWGFVAVHDKSCHAHWNEGQAARRALIAAAPELLEALTALYAVANVDRDESYIAVTRAAAAIAKATGSKS
jgi:hypothetical protein